MRKVSIITILAVAVIAATLAPAGVSAAESETPVATVHVSVGQITWEPHAKGNRLAVTVSGPDGYTFSHVYKKNELAIFQALDPDGKPLPDGVYSYEIQEVTDNPRQREKDDPQGLPGKRKGQATLFPTQSGSFTVLNGALVDPNLQETETNASAMRPTAAAPSDPVLRPEDQVINDDLIVDGSICVGLDCVNGESFGFDTLRLKENNLRIKFDDTSSSASFPNRDWQLTANESSNGGLNKFSIEDITGARIPFTIEAGAPSNSLYVDDGGRIGIKTNNPVVEIHNKDGDTPTLRLEQDGSSGFTPQTWDVAGNETNFFIRDATNGSNLPFRIRPSAPSNSIFVDTDGDIGLGTSSPSAEVHVRRTSRPVRLFLEDAHTGGIPQFETMLELARVAGPPGMLFRDQANNNGWLFRMTSGGNFRLTDTDGAGTDDGDFEFDLQRNGDLLLTGTVNPSSSRELKHNFAMIDPLEILAKVESLWIPVWSYKHQNSDLRHLGPVAEEFYETFGIGIDDKHLNPGDTAGVALAAIQGLYRILKEKDDEIQELRSQIAEVDALKQKIEELSRTLESLAVQTGN